MIAQVERVRDGFGMNIHGTLIETCLICGLLHWMRQFVCTICLRENFHMRHKLVLQSSIRVTTHTRQMHAFLCILLENLPACSMWALLSLYELPVIMFEFFIWSHGCCLPNVIVICQEMGSRTLLPN